MINKWSLSESIRSIVIFLRTIGMFLRLLFYDNNLACLRQYQCLFLYLKICSPGNLLLFLDNMLGQTFVFSVHSRP